LPKLAQLYRNAALLLLNTVLLFLVFNGLIWIFGLVKPNAVEYPSPPPQTSMLPVYGIGALNYEFELLQQARPHMKSREIIRTMLETGNIERVCNSDTLFREQPFKGHTVTVDPAGFRWIQDQATWPPDEDSYNIFVFGCWPVQRLVTHLNTANKKTWNPPDKPPTAHDMEMLFVLPPIPGYAHNLANHPFMDRPWNGAHEYPRCLFIIRQLQLLKDSWFGFFVDDVEREVIFALPEQLLGHDYLKLPHAGGT
jgi:hypothetical protein